MNCEEAKILSIAHILGDLDPNSEQYRQLESHLASCRFCTEEYKSSKWAIKFIEQHKTIFAEVLRTPEEKKAAKQEEIDRSWKCIEARLDEFEAQQRKEKQAKSHRLLVRASAVAACLVIGILTWIVFSNYSKPQTLPQDSSSQHVASALKPSVKVELVTNTGNIFISSDQHITSTDQLKTLLINGKHQMTMNTNTVLAVEPLVEHRNIGCLVKLDSGRIYTHVQHDGNPFIVDTVHGKAVITGTTFDIKATDDTTTLVVSEGTVQFKSEKGVVSVAAGQTSKIVGQSTPSIPLSCNTAELTAWATGYKPGPALAQIELNTDPWYLPLSPGKEPIVLEETDYENWVEQKREWFKQQFLWTFQLKEALAKEGIEADYPELLVKIGDVWQFVCLEVRPARFSVIDPNSLLRTASDYGFDKLWLLENVPAAKLALGKPVLSENIFTDLKAFERWLKYLDEIEGLGPPTPIYSYHASKYLAETRSLIWFAVRGGKYDLTDKERAKVLALLQEEVTAACKCQNELLYPAEEQEKQCCDEKRCQAPVDIVAENIEIMKAIEERIAEYEISK